MNGLGGSVAVRDNYALLGKIYKSGMIFYISSFKLRFLMSTQ